MADIYIYIYIARRQREGGPQLPDKRWRFVVDDVYQSKSNSVLGRRPRQIYKETTVRETNLSLNQ